MRLPWIGVLLLVISSSLMLMSQSATNLQQAQDAGASTEVWGGRDISMEVTPAGATVEFDCAHGNVLEPIKANAKGEFAARGTFTPEHGGPIRKDNPPRDLPATYKGSIEGDIMRLQVLLTDKDQQPEPFTLTRGKPGRVMKCR